MASVCCLFVPIQHSLFHNVSVNTTQNKEEHALVLQGSGFSLGRDLQATEVTSVTPVKTALELQSAIAKGAKHIEIQEHLDLTDLQLVGDELLGTIPATVKTIRVRFGFPKHF